MEGEKEEGEGGRGECRKDGGKGGFGLVRGRREGWGV